MNRILLVSLGCLAFSSLAADPVKFQCNISCEQTAALPPALPPAPVDTDGDGLTDDLDGCPSAAAQTPTGCPVLFTRRINVGGPLFTDSKGYVWEADVGTGGVADTTTGEILNTSDDGLYLDYRYDLAGGTEISYDLEVPNGDYVVDVHLAEVYSPAFVVGFRTFSPEIQGVVEPPVDMFALAGPRTAFAVRYTTKVTDGKLSIRFIHVVENPSVAALAVYSPAAAPAVLQPPVTVPVAGTAMLSWKSPSAGERPEGYQVRYGASPSNLTVSADLPADAHDCQPPDASQTNCHLIPNLPAGKWYFTLASLPPGSPAVGPIERVIP